MASALGAGSQTRAELGGHLGSPCGLSLWFALPRAWWLESKKQWFEKQGVEATSPFKSWACSS